MFFSGNLPLYSTTYNVFHTLSEAYVIWAQGPFSHFLYFMLVNRTISQLSQLFGE